MIQDIAPKKFLLSYSIQKPGIHDVVFVFRGRKKSEDKALMCFDEDGFVRLPTYGQLVSAGLDAAPESFQYLFAIDGQKYFLLNNGGMEDIGLPGFTYDRIRKVIGGHLEDGTALAGMTAYHLFYWYRDNTFCGRCGQKMKPYTKERAVICPACHNLVYPKLLPAVIILVKDGDKVVVSRYADREYKGISLLAGFCEIGETLEQTVAREVMEEVGLQLKNITYYASQPWGVDCDLLMGFTADVDGSREIHRDAQELKEAMWVDRSELAEITNTASLTATMLEAFRKGEIV